MGPTVARTLDNYFQPGWRDDEHTCEACEWRGSSRQMVMELHDDLTEYTCPACENSLLLVLHPDMEQVRQAAAEGHPEAIEQLQIIEAFPRES